MKRFMSSYSLPPPPPSPVIPTSVPVFATQSIYLSIPVSNIINSLQSVSPSSPIIPASVHLAEPTQ
jgi:hypothetical protein